MPDEHKPTLLEKLDTPGGHILVCLLLLFVGLGASVIKLAKAEDIILAGLTGATLSMRGKGSNDK